MIIYLDENDYWEFPNPRGWKRMSPAKKRQVMRKTITLAWVRNNWRGKTATAEKIYERMLAELDQLRIDPYDRRFVEPPLEGRIFELLRYVKGRLYYEKYRVSGIYKLSKQGVEGFYIGRSRDICGRFRMHSGNRPANKGLVKALREKGIYVNVDGLRVDVVEILQNTEIEYMRRREQYYISTLRPLWNKKNEIAEGANVNLDIDSD